MLSFKLFLALCEDNTFSADPESIGDLELLLLEGGNVWKGELATQRISQADVLLTVKWLERLTHLPLVDNMIGSTGRKPTSGDIDLAVDEKKHKKESLIATLVAWAHANDETAEVKKGGVSVHFRTPIKGDPKNGHVQTDFMFMSDLDFVRWSTTPAGTSEYKGVHRTILLASIAKALGLRWSYTNGLSVRETDKKIIGKPLRGGKDPDYVAKTLLGPDATKADLESVETILAKLKNDPQREEKLADARETLGGEGIEL